MKLILFQGIVALTICRASTADVKRQLGFTDIGSYHTFFDAHPTPFIAIARADAQAPPLTSVGIAKPGTPALQAIAPLHDFNFQSVPHAVFLTPVAAKGVALDQGWHGFETAPLKFAPAYSHKALVPVHDAPFELAPVLQNYAISKPAQLTNYGQNHIANNFNKHLNAPPTQFTTFQDDIKQFQNTFQAPQEYGGPVQNDPKQPVAQSVKPINQAAPPSGHGLISSPAPLISSPAYDSQGTRQSSDNGAGGHSSFGHGNGFQGSHHFSPSGPSSSQPITYDSPTRRPKSHGHHHTPKHHGHSGHKHHSSQTSSFGVSGNGGSGYHTPSSTHHTAPSGYGQSSSASPGHTNKGYNQGYSSQGSSENSFHSSHRPTTGHGSSENSFHSSHRPTTGHGSSENSFHSSHRPTSGHGDGFGSTGFGSTNDHSDSEQSSHDGTGSSDHGGKGHGEKATSFQSFVIHSYKAVPVYSKKSEYRHHEPSSDKRQYHSAYYGNSNEYHDDRRY